jgi:hypothetical protein
MTKYVAKLYNMGLIRKNRAYRNVQAGKKKTSVSLKGYAVYEIDPLPNYNIVPQVNEDHMKIPEAYCSHFGCSKILSLTEKLCGDKCSKHMATEPLKIEVLKYANY